MGSEEREKKKQGEAAEQQPPASQGKPLMSGVPGIKGAGGEARLVGDESERPEEEKERALRELSQMDDTSPLASRDDVSPPGIDEDTERIWPGLDEVDGERYYPPLDGVVGPEAGEGDISLEEVGPRDEEELVVESGPEDRIDRWIEDFADRTSGMWEEVDFSSITDPVTDFLGGDYDGSGVGDRLMRGLQGFLKFTGIMQVRGEKTEKLQRKLMTPDTPRKEKEKAAVGLGRLAAEDESRENHEALDALAEALADDDGEVKQCAFIGFTVAESKASDDRLKDITDALDDVVDRTLDRDTVDYASHVQGLTIIKAADRSDRLMRLKNKVESTQDNRMREYALRSMGYVAAFGWTGASNEAVDRMKDILEGGINDEVKGRVLAELGNVVNEITEVNNTKKPLKVLGDALTPQDASGDVRAYASSVVNWVTSTAETELLSETVDKKGMEAKELAAGKLGFMAVYIPREGGDRELEVLLRAAYSTNNETRKSAMDELSWLVDELDYNLVSEETTPAEKKHAAWKLHKIAVNDSGGEVAKKAIGVFREILMHEDTDREDEYPQEAKEESAVKLRVTAEALLEMRDSGSLTPERESVLSESITTLGDAITPKKKDKLATEYASRELGVIARDGPEDIADRVINIFKNILMTKTVKPGKSVLERLGVVSASIETDTAKNFAAIELRKLGMDTREERRDVMERAQGILVDALTSDESDHVTRRCALLEIEFIEQNRMLTDGTKTALETWRQQRGRG